MAVGTRSDPFHGFNFLVEIDGFARFAFRECSGLDSSQAPVDYREGDEPLRVRKLPGLNTYSPISLKRGITLDPDMWDWRRKASEGKVERRNVSIVLMDDTQKEAARWNLSDAWPSKWTGPSFNATSNEVAIESLELVHEGVAKA
jgi:phage tail-like protein